MKYLSILILLTCSLLTTMVAASGAARTPEQLKSMTIEIASNLRCPMATNQTILDSQAAIANELKAEIYLQLEQGKSKDEIVEFMVARYGEKIRYMPSLSVGTFALYLIPLMLFIAVMCWAIWLIKTSRNSTVYLDDEA